MGCLALVNGKHHCPVIQRFLTWSTSAHLFPVCRIVPLWSVKTSGCISIFRFTVDSSLSFCQCCRPPLYVAVQHSSILYVDPRVAWLYRLIRLLWSGTWRFSYLIRHPVALSLISFLYVVLGHWYRLVFPGPAQMIHYVLSVQLYLYTCWIYSVLSIYMMYFWLSMGMPASSCVDSLVSFIGFWQAEIWWSPLLSLRSSFYVHNTFRPSCTPSDLIY